MISYYLPTGVNIVTLAKCPLMEIDFSSNFVDMFATCFTNLVDVEPY